MFDISILYRDLNSKPFNDQTNPHDLNTKLVCYSLWLPLNHFIGWYRTCLVAMHYLKIDFFLRSHALLGRWPNLVTTSKEKTQRRRASTKRHVIFDDFDNDAEQQVVKSRKSNRKATKNSRAKKPAKNDLSLEINLKIVDAEEDESFLQHLNDSIKVKMPLKVDVQWGFEYVTFEYRTLGRRPTSGIWMFGGKSVSKPFKNWRDPYHLNTKMFGSPLAAIFLRKEPFMLWNQDWDLWFGQVCVGGWRVVVTLDLV